MATTGIYTAYYIWNAITDGADNWWADEPLIVAAYNTANDGNVPTWPDGPFVPNGWTHINIWQYSSRCQVQYGWTGDGLDGDIVGPYPPDSSPTPPPTGETYDTSFMRAEPGIWRVIRRTDGSGQDVWEYRIDSQNDARVKNGGAGKPLNEWEAEWYRYGNGGVWRVLDTSPANDPVTGEKRLYMFTEGGQIAPNEAVVGVTYSYPNYVQFKSKENCADLPTDSGPSTSTFLLKEVKQNYTFPSTGFTVDWLYVTVQTGETQLYAIHQGRVYGWVGGGASQDNNVWGGELSEVYFDRQIPDQEPPRFCG